MADAVKKPSRPMKFPYTYAAKFAQFPYKFYYKNNWIARYYPIAILLCIPIFAKITKLSNNPENVAKWAEIRRKELEGHH